jgi:hypothetical protein
MSTNPERPGATPPTGPVHARDHNPDHELAPEPPGPPTLNGRFLGGYDSRPRGRRRARRAAPPWPESRPEPRPEPQAKPQPRRTKAPAPLFKPILHACVGPAEADGADLELILGTGNFLPFAFLREGDRVGRAVVKIARADGAAGTGFLVAPGILLTNHHVLPDRATAADARALANFEAEPPDDPAGRPADVPLRPDTLFVSNAELDFAFCAVEGLDHLGVIRPGRTSLGVLRRDFVNIIQHPRGRPKEVALQDNQVVKADPVVLHYSCDTEPGSSGSPVLDNRWRLVALHHASVVAEESRGGRRSPGGDPRLRYLNEGIRLSAIALWLDTAEADAPALRPHTARLRAMFEGLDPAAGFFGALGRRAGRGHAAQLVVDCYRRDPRGRRTLDLGAWDLTAGRPARDRLDDLGLALAEMALDLWCLAGLGPDDARRLADHLETHHRLEYHVASAPAPGDDRPPVAILYRQGHAPFFSRPSPDGVTAHLQPIPQHPLSVHLHVPGAPTLADAPTPSPWPRAAELAPAPRGGASLLIALDAPIGPDDVAALRRAGHAPRLAASGPGGGLAVLTSGRRRGLDRLFATANLAPLPGSADLLTPVEDRPLPAPTASLSPRPPMALRLVLRDPPRPRRPTPNEPPRRGRTHPDRPAPAEPRVRRKSSSP